MTILLNSLSCLILLSIAVVATSSAYGHLRKRPSEPSEEFVSLSITLEITMTPRPSFVAAMADSTIDSRAGQCLINAFEVVGQPRRPNTDPHVSLSTIDVAHRIFGTPAMSPATQGQDSTKAATPATTTVLLDEPVVTATPLVVEQDDNDNDSVNSNDTNDSDHDEDDMNNVIVRVIYSLLSKFGLVHQEEDPTPLVDSATSSTAPTAAPTDWNASSATAWKSPGPSYTLGGCLLCPSEDDVPAIEESSTMEYYADGYAEDGQEGQARSSLPSQGACGSLCPPEDEDDDSEHRRQLQAQPRVVWTIHGLMESFLVQTSPIEDNGQDIVWNAFRAQTDILEWAEFFCDCFVGGIVVDETDDFFSSGGADDRSPICQIHIQPEFV
ncbi:expressed unknown protein [Seminavis robusta]|uniref:Uncharacterized protein n=1 Tax=Seminavis robusta TaxID=568900 RepID=A0A9N8I013_9STRA|nr:expressed unknown protein [Seminavis robusta]|eukprot:Sro2463_g328430.1 n/a (383) ;mRNA; f:10656-11927